MNNDNTASLRTAAHFLRACLFTAAAGISIGTACAEPTIPSAELSATPSSAKAARFGEMAIEALRIKGTPNL